MTEEVKKPRERQDATLIDSPVALYKETDLIMMYTCIVIFLLGC
jgi:hypothetical protein